MMTTAQRNLVALTLSSMVEDAMEVEFPPTLVVRVPVGDNLLDAADELAANSGGDFPLVDALRPAIAEWVAENRAAIIRRAQELAGENNTPEEAAR